MKPMLSFLLVLSLLGNGWLAYRYVSTSATQPAIPTGESSPNPPAKDTPDTSNSNRSARAATSTPSTVPMVWPQLGSSDDDLRSLAARLRDAGFPRSTIQAIIQQRVRHRDYAPLAQIPFWNLNNPNPATRLALIAAERGVSESVVNILGTDGTPAALLDSTDRARRFGPLSDEKINALLELQKDYQEVSASLNGANNRPMTSGEARSRDEQRRAIESESNADHAQILTPAELAAYELRNSPTAHLVMEHLATTKVSEEEYQALVLLQKNHTSATGGMNSFSASTPEERARLGEQRLAFNEQLRATLGEERFYGYLAKSDSEFAQVARFAAKQPALSKDVTYELYKLTAETQRTFQNLSPTPPTGRDPAAFRTLIQARDDALKEINTRLDTLLGPEIAAAYRQEGTARIYFAPPTPTTNRPPSK